MWKSFSGRTPCDTHLFNRRPCLPSIPFLMKEYPGRRGKNKENNISATNYQVPELPLRMRLAG